MSNLENHNPQVIRQVSKEVKNLATEQLEGIKIVLNESNLTDIQAIIEGPGKRIDEIFNKKQVLARTRRKSQHFLVRHWPHFHITHFVSVLHVWLISLLGILAGTPYTGGQFRVQLTLPKDFPANPPKAYFLTKIFHPNVAANGEICVNTLKKDWKSDLGIKHILLVSQARLDRA